MSETLQQSIPALPTPRPQSRYWTFAATLALAVCVGLVLHAMEWLWMQNSEQFGGVSPAVATLVAVVGPLLYPIVALLPGWLAGWMRPYNAITTGMAAAAIVQFVMSIYQFYSYGIFLPTAIPRFIAAMIGAALLGGAGAGAAQLVRLAGGITAYLDGATPTARRPTAPTPAPQQAVPPAATVAAAATGMRAAPQKLHVAATVCYFLLGILGTFASAVAITLFAGNDHWSLAKMVDVGFVWFGGLLLLMIAAYFVLRRWPTAIYVALTMFVVIPILVFLMFLR